MHFAHKSLKSILTKHEVCYDNQIMFDLVLLLKTVGYVGIFGIVFAESGLFFGFFLPGDSLLFTAGFLSSQGFFHVGFLAVLVCAAAILGDNAGYAFGKKVGPMLFKKEDSFFFHKDHVARAQAFYASHGKKTIVLARFIPVVRTFAPILAGVGQMPYHIFLAYNIAGGAVWSFGFVFAGYLLGAVIPDPDRYVLPIVVVVIVISFLPVILHAWRNAKK